MSIRGLEIDHDGALPVYRQIADGVVAAAADGRLAAGERLPPTRDLARQLGVNRQTVVAAYEHLASEGRVRSRSGKGTFLVEAPRPQPGEAGASTAGDAGWLTSFSRAVEGPNVAGLLAAHRTASAAEGISFAGSYPARELMPVEAFASVLASTLREAGPLALSYGPTAGHLPLRAWLAERLTASGAEVDPDDVLITNGAQQAIELVFHTFLERGDTVVLEEPTYTGVLSVVGSIGARAVPVPVDGEGLRPDLLAIALERHRPRLLYVQPTFHNPTTAVMGEARRREILALAARSRTMIVEDDWASGLAFGGTAPETLHALDRGRHVIYLNTFSKKLLPGLRIGWIAAPRPVTERLLRLKQIRDCGTSPLLQTALHAYLRDGGLERHLARVLPANRERRDAMLGALEQSFPPEAVWTRPEGGLFLWVALPRPLDGDALFRAAGERGVHYSQGKLFHSGADGGHTLRLTYSAPTVEQIAAGVRVLGSLVEELWPAARATERRPLETMPIL